MAGSNGKAETTRQKMLDIIEAFTLKYPSGGMASHNLARKLGLSQGTSSRYLVILWKSRRLVRAKNIDGFWEYRFLSDGINAEKFKKSDLGNRMMHVYEEGNA